MRLPPGFAGPVAFAEPVAFGGPTILYADFVAARLWALRYDPAKQRVVANRPILGPRLAAMSFGEDEQGEAYAMEATANGRGIYRFVRKDK